MRTSSIKALCAVLAVALISVPFVATAARITPSRSLASDSDFLGWIPVCDGEGVPAAPDGITLGRDVAAGRIIGWLPVTQVRVLLGVRIVIGNFIPICDLPGISGHPVPTGTTVLPTAFGKPLSVNVNVVLGPLLRVFGPGAVYGGGILPTVLGTVVGLVDVVLGTVLTLVDVLLVDLLGGVVGVRGLLPVSCAGKVLGGLPILTAPLSAGLVDGLLEPLILGDLEPFGSTPAPSLPAHHTLFPNTLSDGGIHGSHIIGWQTVYYNPQPDVSVTANVLGVIGLAVGVDLSGLLDLLGLGPVRVNVDVLKPIGWVPCLGQVA